MIFNIWSPVFGTDSSFRCTLSHRIGMFLIRSYLLFRKRSFDRVCVPFILPSSAIGGMPRSSVLSTQSALEGRGERMDLRKTDHWALKSLHIVIPPSCCIFENLSARQITRGRWGNANLILS